MLSAKRREPPAEASVRREASALRRALAGGGKVAVLEGVEAPAPAEATLAAPAHPGAEALSHPVRAAASVLAPPAPARAAGLARRPPPATPPAWSLRMAALDPAAPLVAATAPDSRGETAWPSPQPRPAPGRMTLEVWLAPR